MSSGTVTRTTKRSFHRKIMASLGRMLALEMSPENGTRIGPFHTSLTFCRTGHADGGDQDGQTRRIAQGLVRHPLDPDIQRPQATIATKRAIRTPRILRGLPS